MSMEKKKDTCAEPKGKKGKRKRKDGVEEEEEENREMILGEEHWKRWQERNKTPFVSFPDYLELYALGLAAPGIAFEKVFVF